MSTRARWGLAAVLAVMICAVVAWFFASRTSDGPAIPDAASPTLRAPVVTPTQTPEPAVAIAAAVNAPLDAGAVAARPDSGSDDQTLEALRAADAAACDIVDGIPGRPDDGDVAVEIQAQGAVVGALSVHFEVSTERLERGDGKVDPDVIKSLHISHDRVTLLRCRDRRTDLELTLDDGNVARGRRQAEEPTVRLTTSRPATVRGRLVEDGKGVAAVNVMAMGAEGATDADRTDAEGRFVLKLLAPEPAQVVALTLVSNAGSWKFDGLSPTIEYGPGVERDLGDIRVKRRPTVKPGLIGVGFDTSADAFTVQSVERGGPAERAGLKPGDAVVEVDGVGTQSPEEARRRIGGEPGTHVRLKVRRGAEFLLFDVTRQE